MILNNVHPINNQLNTKYITKFQPAKISNSLKSQCIVLKQSNTRFLLMLEIRFIDDIFQLLIPTSHL